MESIEIKGRTVEYSLIRKNVKNINLRIYTDGSISVSAGRLVPKTVIEDFIRKNADRIFKAIDSAASNNMPLRLKTGDTVMLLGKPYRVQILESDNSCYSIAENTIEFHVKQNEDNEAQLLYNRLLTDTAERVFPKLLRSCFPPFSSICGELPSLRIKCLKSQWGNCYYKRNLITLNSRLAAYNEQVICSVIFHEYCHFVYQNHSKEFYLLLDSVMPDWRKYDKILKNK